MNKSKRRTWVLLLLLIVGACTPLSQKENKEEDESKVDEVKNDIWVSDNLVGIANPMHSQIQSDNKYFIYFNSGNDTQRTIYQYSIKDQSLRELVSGYLDPNISVVDNLVYYYDLAKNQLLSFDVKTEQIKVVINEDVIFQGVINKNIAYFKKEKSRYSDLSFEPRLSLKHLETGDAQEFSLTACHYVSPCRITVNESIIYYEQFESITDNNVLRVDSNSMSEVDTGLRINETYSFGGGFKFMRNSMYYFDLPKQSLMQYGEKESSVILENVSVENFIILPEGILYIQKTMRDVGINPATLYFVDNNNERKKIADLSQFQLISNLQTFNNDLYFLTYPDIILTVDMRKDLYKVDLQTGEISKTLANEVDQYLIVDDKLFAIAKNQIVQITIDGVITLQ